MWNGHSGHINVAKHHILLLNDNLRPVYSVGHGAEPTVRSIAAAEIGQMVTKKVSEPASTERATPIVIDTKKYSSLCFLFDHRKLNAVTTRDLYYLPRIDEYVDNLGEATRFSTLDEISVYCHKEIDEWDQDKTAFTSHHGLYRFIWMVFGLEIAFKFCTELGCDTWLRMLAVATSLFVLHRRTFKATTGPHQTGPAPIPTTVSLQSSRNRGRTCLMWSCGP